MATVSLRSFILAITPRGMEGGPSSSLHVGGGGLRGYSLNRHAKHALSCETISKGQYIHAFYVRKKIH
jgi:hypothetical protein